MAVVQLVVMISMFSCFFFTASTAMGNPHSCFWGSCEAMEPVDFLHQGSKKHCNHKIAVEARAVLTCVHCTCCRCSYSFASPFLFILLLLLVGLALSQPGTAEGHPRAKVDNLAPNIGVKNELSTDRAVAEVVFWQPTAVIPIST